MQLRAVVEDVAAVVAAACHQKIEHGRFAAAGAADNGVALACFKTRADAMQDFLTRFIREGDILQFDCVGELARNVAPVVAAVVAEGLRNLVD